MSKDKSLVSEIHEVQKDRKKAALAAKTDGIRYCLKSLTMLVEASAMAATAGYAIYSGWYANLPKWGATALLIAGSFIALRAFVEFVKFLNRRG